MANKILALYDFASKQEYIYRTSKIKEISGASLLLSKIYKEFMDVLCKANISIAYKDESGEYINFDIDSFKNSDYVGQVLYDGGGNLMVLFKTKEIYINANKIISEMLLKNYPGLLMVSACVEVDGKNSFSKDIINSEDSSKNIYSDVTKLYRENQRQKGLYPASDISGVIPMTQIDPMTYSPVIYKFSKGDNKKNPYPLSEVSLSAERYVKAMSYEKENYADFDEGLVAVIYIDGNSMGKKLQSLSAETYNDGVCNLRYFSQKVQEVFVKTPLDCISKSINYRRVIGGGDEITLICRAEDALKTIEIYFESLNNSDCVIPESCKEDFYRIAEATTAEEKEAFLKNTSCAGIAVVHAKSPFTVAYELAESACESAKKKAHENPGNYFDFYYCHAGATTDFDTLRVREQSMTGRPYQFENAMTDFSRIQPVLKRAGRANVKALGSTIQKSDTDFAFEVERVNSYLKSDCIVMEDKKLIYDVSEFFDIWFSDKGVEHNEETTEDNA